MYYVYTIFNLINGKIYVGQTKHIKERWNKHSYFSSKPGHKSHNLIHRAILKYGKENFQFTIIQSFNSKKECFDAEEYWISFYKSNVNRYGKEFGYNLTDGGEGNTGRKHSKTSKEKMSIFHRGETNPKSKINGQVVIEIRRAILNGTDTKKLAIKYGISTISVNQIKRGSRWNHIDNSSFTAEELQKLEANGNIGKVLERPNAKRKITEEQAITIKQLINNGERMIDISKKLNISYNIINQIKLGYTWKNI